MVEPRCGLSRAGCTWGSAAAAVSRSAVPPFHGACPLARCRQGRGHPHCGGCLAFPCALSARHFNDPAHGDTPPGARIGRGRAWAEEKEERKAVEIYSYSDFVEGLLAAGFALGGSNAEGIYTLVPWDWREQPPYDTPVRWHTGDPETDPWEWRMRVLTERDDIAYGKVFFKKSGYITRAWYPYFLAARRQGRTLFEAYEEGQVSREAKRVYEALLEADSLPAHELKRRAGFSSQEKAPFERALTELQMGLYITVCGRQQKRSQTGEGYGWPSAAFCTAERFWGCGLFREAAALSPQGAEEAIARQVYRLNPEAPPKKVQKFIRG